MITNRLLTLNNWDYLNYTSTVYEIAPTVDGKFMASVHLFLTDPKLKESSDNDVIIVPLSIVLNSPLEIATYLYLLGPIFNFTSNKAMQVDKEGKVIKMWDLDMRSLSAENQLQKIPIKNEDELKIKPNHSGSNTVN